MMKSNGNKSWTEKHKDSVVHFLVADDNPTQSSRADSSPLPSNDILLCKIGKVLRSKGLSEHKTDYCVVASGSVFS